MSISAPNSLCRLQPRELIFMLHPLIRKNSCLSGIRTPVFSNDKLFLSLGARASSAPLALLVDSYSRTLSNAL